MVMSQAERCRVRGLDIDYNFLDADMLPEKIL